MEEAGTRCWGTARGGSSGGHRFSGWVGNYAYTVADHLEAPTHWQNFCFSQGCLSGQQRVTGAQGIHCPT